ncbi:retropepsin-like aspartic protease family protein [Paracidovorax konjaci]|uniref:Aspartyl protease family protein n=1 Tax=Paracidovorax konjaci TaxID=32040 RepID=A0A1I1WLS0_9BURK|nr:TIGR02281 family clan AA aspartic protease [Paracidovorax konjaci]SFD96115.1 aspartyl protease family protein [Paracidovorax konjaci]
MRSLPRFPRAAWAYALALAPALAGAQAVALTGILGSKALIVVDANPPRALGAGESFQGVKVISVGRDDAVLETASGRRTVLLGEAPVSVGGRGAGTGRRVVLTADGRGHFVSNGTINGKAMQYLVDTGASTVAIGQPDADRMGLDYRSGTPVALGTANGTARGWRVKLDSVRLGDVEVFGVDAVVTPQGMPFVLLGNSVLNEFQMTRSNDQLVLEKRR